MGFYKKKPVTIQAFKWTADWEQTEDLNWMQEALDEGVAWLNNAGTPDVKLEIKTLEGVMTASRGDYIIRGIKGEIYPCKSDIFEATYEFVSMSPME